jgi:hypothetical protein
VHVEAREPAYDHGAERQEAREEREPRELQAHRRQQAQHERRDDAGAERRERDLGRELGHKPSR